MVAKDNTSRRLKRRTSREIDSSSFSCENKNKLNHLETLVAPSERFAQYCNTYNRQINGNDSKNKIERNSKSYIDLIGGLIRKCNLDDDPLIHWLRYIDHIKQGHRRGSSTVEKKQLRSQNNADSDLFLVMKRCTHALLNHPKYTNDPRFIRIIVIYADQIQNSNEKEEMFEYYYRRNVGTQTAIFWISWAFVMEKSFDYKAANRIYTKAMRIDAQPVDVVKKRYRGFQHRVRYYGIDIEEEEEEQEEQEEEQTIFIKDNVKAIDHREKGDRDIGCDGNTKKSTTKVANENVKDSVNRLENEKIQTTLQCSYDVRAIESTQSEKKNDYCNDIKSSIISNPSFSQSKKHVTHKQKFTIYEDQSDTGNYISNRGREETKLSNAIHLYHAVS